MRRKSSSGAHGGYDDEHANGGGGDGNGDGCSSLDGESESASESESESVTAYQAWLAWLAMTSVLAWQTASESGSVIALCAMRAYSKMTSSAC
jgi:hypothetical protein